MKLPKAGTMAACVWCFKYGRFPAWRPKKSNTLILHNSVQPLKQYIHGINGVPGKCSYNLWIHENLVIIFNQTLSFHQHVQHIKRKAFFHPKNHLSSCQKCPLYLKISQKFMNTHQLSHNRRTCIGHKSKVDVILPHIISVNGSQAKRACWCTDMFVFFSPLT